jgi:hypothetical protein
MKMIWFVAAIAAVLAVSGLSRNGVLYAGSGLDDGYDWLSPDQVMPKDVSGVDFEPSDVTVGTCEEVYMRSAVFIPEPATLAILGIGSLTLLRRKK